MDRDQTLTSSIFYVYKNALYVNVTSRCPCACRFCIKFSWDYKFRGYDLKLADDPSIERVLSEIPADLKEFDEVVYCGYGEATYRLSDMPVFSSAFRKRGARRIRLNTIGLGNLIHGRDIVPELRPYVDAVSVSLNTLDPQKYIELVRPLPEYREKALESAKAFCRSCVKHIPETTLTTLDHPDFNAKAVEEFAVSIKAKFNLRAYLSEHEER